MESPLTREQACLAPFRTPLGCDKTICIEYSSKHGVKIIEWEDKCRNSVEHHIWWYGWLVHRADGARLGVTVQGIHLETQWIDVILYRIIFALDVFSRILCLHTIDISSFFSYGFYSWYSKLDIFSNYYVFFSYTTWDGGKGAYQNAKF